MRMLWTHLAADPNRLLDDCRPVPGARRVRRCVGTARSHVYSRVIPPVRGAGCCARCPTNPLIAYYRAFVGQRLGRDDADAYRRASILATTYVFPNRASSYAVLNAALAANPDDGTARYLRGCLYLSSGLVASAIADWERARTVAPDLPTLHRNLGMTLLHEGQTRRGDCRPERRHRARRAKRRGLRGARSGLRRDGNARRRARGGPGAISRFGGHAAGARLQARARARGARRHRSVPNRCFTNRFFPREEGGYDARTCAGRRARCGRSRSGAVGTLRRRAEAARRPEPPGGTASGSTRRPSNARSATRRCSLRLRVSSPNADGTTDARERRRKLAQNAMAAAQRSRVPWRSQRAARSATSRRRRPRRTCNRCSDDLAAALDDGDTGSPGLVAYTRARLLSALGRGDEARQAHRPRIRVPRPRPVTSPRASPSRGSR